jgi:hypothetical protein
VHIHIPKTGGTAIERSFADLDDLQWDPASWIGEVHRDGRWYEYQHLTLNELRAFTGDEFADHATFAVVRDPYQRLISDHLWRRGLTKDNPATFLRAFESFDDFVRAIPAGIDAHWDHLVDGADRTEANFLIHVRPQHHFLRGDGGGLDGTVHVVRFEGLPGVIDELFGRWDVECHKMRRPSVRPLADFYTAETLEIVGELYHADFELLGYDKVVAPLR